MPHGRLELSVVVVAFAVGVFAPPALGFAQYSITDLGPSSLNGAAFSISPSGTTVGMECATWFSGVVTPGGGNCALFGAVNSHGEAVGPSAQPTSTNGTGVQAFSESPTGQPRVDFLTGPLTAEYSSVQNPSESANAIDDGGEIGGGVLSQPGGGNLAGYAYIFNPAAAAGAQVSLFSNAYDVYGLWPQWAELESTTPLYQGSAFTFTGLYDRATGTTTVTNVMTPAESYGNIQAASLYGSSVASDGTVVGLTLSPCTPPSSSTCLIYGPYTLTPTMRLANGSETTLDTTGYVATSSQPEAVNAGHYSVGYVHLPNEVNTEATEWSPTGQVELLNNLIPSGLGWDLQTAVAISDNGAIVGTGLLNGVHENFLLTTPNALPTSTTGACIPGMVAPRKTTSCTFTVADTTPGSTQTPTGTVTVSSDQPGAISPASVCTLAATPTAGRAACAISYTPTQAGAPTLTGTYSGDGAHGSSHGSVTVAVASAKATHPKVSGTTASASISCTGPAGSSCTETLTLSVVETLSGHNIVAVTTAKHKPKKSKRTVVLGVKTVTLGAGQTKTVRVALNATGKSLLRSRHKLAVKLTASQKAGPSSTFTVKFTVLVKKHKRG
jgi:hypothetical protein